MTTAPAAEFLTTSCVSAGVLNAPACDLRTPFMLPATRANKAIGHYWFEHDPVRAYRRETKLLGGRYWVESSWNFDGTKREYLVVAAEPNGGVGYLHGAERFPTLAEAVAVINAILEARR
jgi:hypothetical protein